MYIRFKKINGYKKGIGTKRYGKITNMNYRKKKKYYYKAVYITTMLVLALVVFLGCFIWWKISQKRGGSTSEYSGMPYIIVNGGIPYFEEADMTTTSFEQYSELDSLGRCGVAFANLSRDLMPTEERGEIGEIRPTGWRQAKYPGVVDSNPPYLYNRCHLIAYCLTGQNANVKNLITGTRYMNNMGMLPFEEEVARYLEGCNNHVLYRVTPVFEDRNLLASGVLMEAYSVEDKGRGVCFCVYVYNVQPGVEIDYRTGENRRA